MAASVTITLTGVGRAPGCFRASALTASCSLRINSGSVMLPPHAASGFSAWNISCAGQQGIGNGRGFIGQPPTGEQSGRMTLSGAGSIAVGFVQVERVSGVGSSSVLKGEGGGTQLPASAPA